MLNNSEHGCVKATGDLERVIPLQREDKIWKHNFRNNYFYRRFALAGGVVVVEMVGMMVMFSMVISDHVYMAMGKFQERGKLILK